ncbi:hypothetical protein RhiJN_17217 [Ceratobasidium sp. AG-Ba]|nr:hypothetical protein RhiJN_17217 [Ceratobasidium sp. AG-Ba]
MLIQPQSSDSTTDTGTPVCTHTNKSLFPYTTNPPGLRIPLQPSFRDYIPMGKTTALARCRYCGWSGKNPVAVERHIGQRPTCAAERMRERNQRLHQSCSTQQPVRSNSAGSKGRQDALNIPPSPPSRSLSVKLEEIEDEDALKKVCVAVDPIKHKLIAKNRKNNSPQRNPNAILEAVEEEIPGALSPGRYPTEPVGEIEHENIPEEPRWGPHPYAKPTRPTLFPKPHPDPTAGVASHYHDVNREAPPKYSSVLAEPDVFREAYWLDHLPISRSDKAQYFALPRTCRWYWNDLNEFEQEVNRLPHGPRWCRETIMVTGDEYDEILDLWKRDIIEMVRFLLADPRFIPHTRFAPEQHYDSRAMENRVYDEMWSGQWWWQMQNILGQYATVVPIIISTDKTKLTVFSGNQKAWPVYLTIGNISKDIRRCPSERATLLIGYIPVSNLDNISNEQERRKVLHQLDRGVFGDHVLKWTTALLTPEEMDRRTRGMPRFQDLRHFSHGTSVISLWTGKEAKALARTILAIVAGYTDPRLVRAVKSVVDFMARAHKHEITDADLAEMKRDLLEFERSKGVFVDSEKKGLLNHEDRFHGIAKTHSLTHYPYLICQLGAPEGFSTEMTERLHIEFVKKPWATTNHVNALQQMIAHLQNREAWALLRAYMHDARLVMDPRFPDDWNEDNDSGEDEPGDMVDGDSGRGHGDDPVWQPTPTIQIAKRPSLGAKVKGAYLINKHGATDLVPATIDYLRTLAPTRAAFPISHNTAFQVWRRCKLRHSRLPFDPALGPHTNQVRAFNTSVDSEGRVLRVGFFDVVLFSPNRGDTGQRGLHELEAGRVRAIFSLPNSYQSFCSERLVYLERFRPFSEYPSTLTSLYTTQHALQGGVRGAVVVPLSQLRMTCHLAPRYNLLDPRLPISSSTDLLAIHQRFSLNKFASAWLFSVLDYWENQRRLRDECVHLIPFIMLASSSYLPLGCNTATTGSEWNQPPIGVPPTPRPGPSHITWPDFRSSYPVVANRATGSPSNPNSDMLHRNPSDHSLPVPPETSAITRLAQLMADTMHSPPPINNLVNAARSSLHSSPSPHATPGYTVRYPTPLWFIGGTEEATLETIPPAPPK